MAVFEGNVSLAKHVSAGRHKQHILINHDLVKK